MRKLLAILALCGAFAGQGQAQAAPVQVGAVGGITPTLWPVLVGNKFGYFGAAGPLEMNFAPSSAAVMQQVAVNAVSMAVSAGLSDPIRAAVRGAPVALVRIDGQSAPYALLAKPSIHTLAELKGKTISVGGAKDITRAYLERMLAPSGLKTGSYDLIYAGATSARFAALQAGAADAAILFPPFNFLAQKAGFNNLGLVVTYAPDLPFSGIAVNRKWARRNKQLLTEVLAGYNKSVAWLEAPANRDAAITLLQKSGKASRKDIALTYDFFRTIHYFAPTGAIPAHDLRAIMKVLVRQHDIPAQTPIGKIVLRGIEVTK